MFENSKSIPTCTYQMKTERYIEKAWQNGKTRKDNSPL